MRANGVELFHSGDEPKKTAGAEVRVGLAGWSYAHWVGTVYPSKPSRNFHPLEYLARYFDAMEVNTSFHRALRPEISRLWLKKVAANPNFQFTVKLGRRFTHERSLDEAEITAFKEGLWPFLRAGKMGALLMQFPWSFRFTGENKEFLIRLRRAFHEFPLTAEMRHSSWMMDEALGTLVDYRIGFCNIDQPEHTRAMPPTSFLTSPVGYVRLHGRDRRNWFQDFDDSALRVSNTNYLYSEQELEAWRARIERIRPHAGSLFVIANNDGGGKAVVNALQLQRMLQPGRVEAPAGLIARYRLEMQGFHSDRPVQQTLFDLPGRVAA
ncbi:MAG: DUF72 domain-containing protein [Acidobacteria bacterium]|nr:DUF72 domain-containing protein [Acidobacteriota bacterium]